VTVTVPIDLDVIGGGLSDAIEDDLRDARGAARKAGADAGDAFGDGFEREVSRSAKEVDTLLAEATRTRTADIEVDIDGMANLASLRESLDLTKQRAEVASLERALEDVAKLRRAGVDVEVEGQRELAALDRALKAVERRHVVEVDIETDRDTDVFADLGKSAQRSGGAISEAFAGAFQLVAKNAILLTVAVSAAFATFPVIGAVAATGLVLGFGGAIAGIGILAAAQSDRVQTAFGDMADSIVKDMRRIAAPLEGSLVSVAYDIEQAFAGIAPALERSFAQLAPALTSFSDQFFDAFGNLEPAIQPLTDAFTDLLDSIGPRLDGFFADLSDSLINLSNVISADPELFSALFVGLLGIIPAAINLIADLAQTFQIIVDIVRGQLAPAWEDLKAALGPVTQLFADATGGLSIFKIGLGVTVAAVFGVVTAVASAIRVFTLLVQGVRAAASFVANAWRNTGTVTANAFARVRASVASAIANVRATVSRGLSAVRATFSSVWNSARTIVTGAMASVRAAVTGAISRVISTVAGGLARVRSAFSSGFAAARSVVTGAMSSIRSAVSNGISNVVGVVRGLPGRIVGALGGLGSLLYASGLSMISGLANGIRAGIGDAVSAAQSAVSAVRNFFPFSPAKEGPFSGRGYTTYSGEALMKDFAKSMEETAASVSPQVENALNPFAGAIPSVTPRGSTAAASQTTINQGIEPGDLAGLLGGIKIIVQPGMDRRAMAELWLNGKKMAETLA